MSTPGLPIRRACELEELPAARRWLIEGLWADQAVGIVGGEPKCCKSFLALDLAVAVASGAACLRRFRCVGKGPVLLYAAEDALHIVRQRLEGIARTVDVCFHTLDVHVITAPALRLDISQDRQSLRGAVAELRPRLLVLDPLVRLHRIDENVASEVGPLLAYLRALQRKYHTAVAVVHHARKSTGRLRGGQALRGSSDLHAWGDSNLYLRRSGESLRLSIEHRAAPSCNSLALELRERDSGLALHVVDAQPRPSSPSISSDPTERILQTLASANRPLSRSELRQICRMRTSTLGELLGRLAAQGRLVRLDDGYRLTDSS